MSETIFNGRIIYKHDTEANWKLATSFIPKNGEPILYDVNDTHDRVRLKFGDGVTVADSLPFIDTIQNISLAPKSGQVLGIDADGNYTWIDIPESVPATTTDDNDKILSVVNGVPAWVAITNAEGVAY